MAETDPSTGKPVFVLLAGFGLPGRVVAERVRSRGLEFRVIEKNPAAAARALAAGWPVVEGDALEARVLREAGIERATVFSAMMPDQADVLKCVQLAKSLNPAIRIIARCTYISGGLEAAKRGAVEVVVAEQAVAREFDQAIQRMLQTA
jgi:CPA2 family monovalent cation:H+ antiporter-2